MVIRFADGSEAEGILLVWDQDTMRVAVKDREDVLALNCVSGNWMTDDGSRVKIEFEWQRSFKEMLPSEADCICSKQMAAQLRYLFFDSFVEESRHLSFEKSEDSKPNGSDTALCLRAGAGPN